VNPARVSTKGIPPPPAPANCKTVGTFDGWMREFRREAAAEGISQRTISDALDGMTLDQSVISRDRKQGFFAQSFTDFSAKLATNNRVQNGRTQIQKNRETFDRVEKQFGVPASVITGFWALESDFGSVGMGKFQILRSLATLAYDCRRGPMFRDELKAALRIIERGDMTPADMIGSWAGEIGQTQFLPTRYLEHALDYDGDGHPDLFRNPTDIIGTTANYMNHLGWRPNEPWLEEVRVPGKLPWEQADLTIKHPRSQWSAWGVTKADGTPLENDAMPATLLLPMGRLGPAFMAFPNFDVYLQWNQSLNYATTAAYLATRIDGAPVMRRGAQDIPVLSPEEAKDLQRLLTQRGFDVGEIDGKIGLKSRQAIKAMQLKYKLPADSYPTPELLAALRGG
jgi:lytic murein transglycosylase